MTKVGLAVEKGETQGFMQIVVDADTEKILGAAILGVGGDEVIHSIHIMSASSCTRPYRAPCTSTPMVSELVPTTRQEMTPLT